MQATRYRTAGDRSPELVPIAALGVVLALPLLLRWWLARPAALEGEAPAAGLQARLEAHRQARVRAAAKANRLDHDLRTPINTLAAALALANGNTDPQMQLEVQNVMERQIGRLTGLAGELNRLARELGDEGVDDACRAQGPEAPWDMR